MDNTVWQTKLYARLHDPMEKALALLRDSAGYEGDASRALHQLLFKEDIPEDVRHNVKRAEWWASAADRPQWPDARWTQVHWMNEPILIHPLTGKKLHLKTLAETNIGDIGQRCLDHLSSLTVRDGDEVDWRRTLLAFWRFGPELPETGGADGLRELWPLLPADTRVPDHSIWDHLALTSAFAGAFARGEPALLSLSLGPVQGFIAAARTTSDLWAGSHLLARLSWQAMKVICEQLGPDAILFPRLRTLPMTDLWLCDKDGGGLPRDWFEHCRWTEVNTDANPLFAAALPNRFVALVPQAEVPNLVGLIEESVRDWLLERGQDVVRRLLEAAKLPCTKTAYCHRQIREQLKGFPEVHWAAAPFCLIQPRNRSGDTGMDTAQLSEAMAPFFGKTGEPGFLGESAWKVLRKGTHLDGAEFYVPNPGVLYPAIHELAERTLAAAKSVRPFGQREEKGWRCSLTGEVEWLTIDPAQLEQSYRARNDTLWAKVAEKNPSWAKKGEHLGALAAIKRLWPTLFAEEVGRATRAIEVGQAADNSGANKPAERFVVSTHTMALASNLERLNDVLCMDAGKRQCIKQFIENKDQAPALPRRLAHLRRKGKKEKLAARVPAALDRLRESDEGAEQLVRLESALKDVLGHKPEAYYALLLFDGDHMGRILSGDPKYAISYRKSFHPSVRKDFRQKALENPMLQEYTEQKRAMSPNRHLAISGALNDFALRVVPHVVEWEFHGRVIYAGGDDVLAMLPVINLLPAMRRLREAYSGGASADAGTDWDSAVGKRNKLVCRKGFALLDNQLMRMMGDATGSCGAVVAHHQTPLSAVLTELRRAEQRAKNEGGRDAFSLSMLKRSGGDLRFTAKWDAIEVLMDFGKFLSAPKKPRQSASGRMGDEQDQTPRSPQRGVSRRAVYNSLVWLKDLPNDAGADMLGRLLGYQLKRQASGAPEIYRAQARPLACRLAQLAVEAVKRDTKRKDRQDGQGGDPSLGETGVKSKAWLFDCLSVAEFLARESRLPSPPSEPRENGA